MRAPQLYTALQAFCLGSFRALLAEIERGAELPFAFDEHQSYSKPALYEYRPLVKPFIEQRAHTLRERPDAQIAVEELLRQPAATIFARAHAGPRAREVEALFGSVLLPLLVETGEICGGFDWDDDAFARAYADLERSLFGNGHQYGAVAPVIGITTGGATIELGGGIRLRHAATGELAKMWPEAANLLPTDFGREPDRLCVLELERALDAASQAHFGARDRGEPASSRTSSVRSGSQRQRRSRPGRCCSSGSTGVRTGSVPSCRSPRRSRRASRRGSIRSAPRSRGIYLRSSAAPTTTP